MKTVLLAVRDQKSVSFTQPFTAATRGIALRSWTDQLNDPQHADKEAAKHPEDFTLWYLGTYNDETASFELLERPEQIAVASDLKR